MVRTRSWPVRQLATTASIAPVPEAVSEITREPSGAWARRIIDRSRRSMTWENSSVRK